MKVKYQHILERIFKHPASGNIRWDDIVSLLEYLGAQISEAEGSRVCIRLFNDRRIFHRPHPSPDADKGVVAHIRGWLDQNGVRP